MKKNPTIPITSNKRLLAILVGIAFILLVPLVAMQFTDEVKWTFFDFIAAAVLLFSSGLALELILQKVKTTRSRFIAGAVVCIALMLVWAELAVGIFGTPFAGN
ncbi:putative integral membrane protein [Flavobacterium sp. CG_23.5]|uniref:hypothetical protein n=1 Tax=Flavobacterium sp. CG_23.5 TaxID=2760708 RepID=UPI0018CB3DFB|nr:hypothetical protein [Flavobacterium sp. CG_23.5]MBP2284147.1 putative integral membrane protein [Flavobacterium sp. CG_23.5]